MRHVIVFFIMISGLYAVEAPFDLLDKKINILRQGKILVQADVDLCEKSFQKYRLFLNKKHNTTSNYRYSEPDRTSFYLCAARMGIIDPKKHNGWTIISQLSRICTKNINTRIDAGEKDPYLFYAVMMRNLNKGPNGKVVKYFVALYEQDKFLAEQIVDLAAYGSAKDSLRLAEYLAEKNHPFLAMTIMRDMMLKKENNWLMYYNYSHILFEIGRYEEAEKVAKECAKKFDYPGIVADFYHTTMRESIELRKKYIPKYELFIQSYYGQKHLPKVTFDNFTSKPNKGVSFIGSSKYINNNKIPKGAVLVALDGIKVENIQQYYIARDHKFRNPYMDIIIWDGKKYQELKKIYVPDRLFGVSIKDYSI